MPQPRDASVPLPPVIPVAALQRWLPEVFPEGVAHRNFVVREMAAKTLFVMLYTGAIEGTGVWFRPAQATLMSDAQAAKTTAAQRQAWRRDSLVAGRLKPGAGSWYATNTREPIRDETLRNGLIPLGAVVERANVPTTSASPRYAIGAAFARLLTALCTGAAGAKEIELWRKSHLSAEAMARVGLLKKGAAVRSGSDWIPVRFPNGETRRLLPGPSAEITKAVVEVFAPRFLREPVVLFISESGAKVVARDDELARQIGLRIEVDRNLPDLILVDVAAGHEKLVFVEVVATDGAVTPARREALAKVAASARFQKRSVFFVTAFLDRSRSSFRRLVGEIAWGTFAWFAAEPDRLLCFRADAVLESDDLSD